MTLLPRSLTMESTTVGSQLLNSPSITPPSLYQSSSSIMLYQYINNSTLTDHTHIPIITHSLLSYHLHISVIQFYHIIPKYDSFKSNLSYQYTTVSLIQFYQSFKSINHSMPSIIHFNQTFKSITQFYQSLNSKNHLILSNIQMHESQWENHSKANIIPTHMCSLSASHFKYLTTYL